jgi:hypothetical protein
MDLRKSKAERNIKRIKKALEELDAAQNPDLMQPIEDPKDTFIIQKTGMRRQKLLEELKHYEAMLAEASGNND